MADFIEAKNEEIAAACLQLGIKKLFVLDQLFEMALGLERAILTFLLSLAHWKSPSASMSILTLARRLGISFKPTLT